MSEPIKNRYEFVLLFDVENGNPNRDPDMGNMPKIDPQTGFGIVTDVALKRKIRDYVDLVKSGQKGYDIYVKSGIVLNDQHKKAYDFIKKPVSKNPSTEDEMKLISFMCQNFFDIRAFGAVMTLDVNCGQAGDRSSSTFAGARIVSSSRKSPSPAGRGKRQGCREGPDDGEETDRSLRPVPCRRLHLCTPRKESHRIRGDDLALLWESLVNMFEHDHSAARGKLSARKLIVFKHESELGCCQSHVLFDKVKVERLPGELPPRSFSDYKVTVAKDVPKGVEVIEKL